MNEWLVVIPALVALGLGLIHVGKWDGAARDFEELTREIGQQHDGKDRD